MEGMRGMGGGGGDKGNKNNVDENWRHFHPTGKSNLKTFKNKIS